MAQEQDMKVSLKMASSLDKVIGELIDRTC